MSSIGQKVEYVRQQASISGNHHCHWPGCGKSVPPAKWGCQNHWYTLPVELRKKIWAAFKPGQEISKTPSREYIEVARETRAWIESYLLQQPRQELLL